ncbi:MAG: phosphate signaling complex protein PhoU [Actinobacteria bacterium]|nr:phosphate signaling complex protein PhoU [Actinomycetota bacterium]
MRKTFHEKLDEVTEDLLQMGSIIQDTFSNAMEALINNDMELAQKVIDGDSKIDDYDIMIEEKCMVIQAEYQPVAVDLRLIHSIYIIDIYLERIGDICVSIAKLARRLYLKEKINMEKAILDLLIEMSNVVKTILDKALRAFRNRDAKLASKLEQMDDTIDSLQKAIYKKLYSSHSRDKNYIKIVTNVSLLSRYLERVGDNSVNIGDRVVYFLTGDFRAIHSEL